MEKIRKLIHRIFNYAEVEIFPSMEKEIYEGAAIIDEEFADIIRDSKTLEGIMGNIKRKKQALEGGNHRSNRPREYHQPDHG